MQVNCLRIYITASSFLIHCTRMTDVLKLSSLGLCLVLCHFGESFDFKFKCVFVFTDNTMNSKTHGICPLQARQKSWDAISPTGPSIDQALQSICLLMWILPSAPTYFMLLLSSTMTMSLQLMSGMMRHSINHLTA